MYKIYCNRLTVLFINMQCMDIFLETAEAGEHREHQILHRLSILWVDFFPFTESSPWRFQRIYCILPGFLTDGNKSTFTLVLKTSISWSKALSDLIRSLSYFWRKIPKVENRHKGQNNIICSKEQHRHSTAVSYYTKASKEKSILTKREALSLHKIGNFIFMPV